MTAATTPERWALTGRVAAPDGLIDDGVVVVEGGRILWVGAAAQTPEPWRGIAAPHGWVAGRTLLPGLVDTHCHGGAGGEFGVDGRDARTTAAYHHRSGTTTLVASIVSGSPETMLSSVATCAALVRDGDLAGIHLEGPFLSAARCGAQDPGALIDVDPALVAGLVAAANDAGADGADGAAIQMTYAPERSGAGRLPRLLSSYGVVPAVGHTDADESTTRAALALARDVAPRGGKPVVTHVFNGMAPLHHRAPGPVAACLAAAARGDAVLEVVADGVHLAAGTVRMLFEVVGPHGLHLVTDAMAASGMPDGSYILGRQRVAVTDGVARLADGGAIAGGTATLLDVVRWCVQDAGISLGDAVLAASQTPAASFDLASTGRLAPGCDADVLVVDDDLRLLGVMRQGDWIGPPLTTG